jgi:hypothetical protein
VALVCLVPGLHMNYFDNLVRVVSSARSPHMNCLEVDYCLAMVAEVVASCCTAHFAVGNVFGLILEAGG